MKAIGFRNFRKFENFPVLEMGDITIFVGGNNSGKSTTVKAIVSVLTFLKNTKFQASGNDQQIRDIRFYFNQNPFVHVGTFARAKCNKNDSKDIFFEIQLEKYNLCIFLNGEGCDENTTYAIVDRIILKDSSTLFEFDINFKEDRFTAVFNKNTQLFEKRRDYVDLVERIKELDEKDKLSWMMKRNFHERFPVVNEKGVFDWKISEIFRVRRMVGGTLFSSIFYNVSYLYGAYMMKTESDFFLKKYSFLRTYLFRLSSQLDDLLWRRPLVEYIYAHAASQIILYNASDNNYLSKTVHEFAELREDKDYEAFNFVRTWMDIFDIGVGFSLDSVGGEAHTFGITDSLGKITPLADKGMGTIQLMILILRIAIIVSERRMRLRYRNPITVIVEEPELNLHPQKQSQLLDFFTNVSEKYDVKFIIETHSEYLVRKSQVMVAEKKYETQEELEAKCPYKVYYFPEDDVPYKMNYRPDGKFSNKFGSGFFDEATKLSFELY